MLPAQDLDPATGQSASGHPFAYARILGVFHAEVLYNTGEHRLTTHTMEFLWVQWYQFDASYKGGFAARRLHRLHLAPDSDSSAFGFVDPDDVIRGAHIIPAFAFGIRLNTEFWNFYYVNLSV